ncbi:ATP-dependent RNA helicase DBP5 [Achlya hypogyna]|uniref:RNA helicase n=1 Tax=Achlya hypogyna TaxID=1202772 RepID=A0A1V9ZMZ1_ACHHY|nr:ATP-dependent RNA helicase DBP5 [Achlya hypogyna]
MSSPAQATPADAPAADAALAAVAPPAAPAETDAFNTDDIANTLEHIMAMGQGLDDQEYTDSLTVLQNDPNTNLYSAVTFEELNLPENLLKGVYAMKFTKPSKIQSVALPMILANPPENLIGQAQSGSGKTATFVLGMLYRASIDPTLKQVQSLCLAPTRELARQIMAVANIMGKFCGIETFLAVPGNDVERGQTVTAQIVVGTPGRVESLIKKKQLNLKDLKIFVLDEADVMIDESGMRDRSLAIKKYSPHRASAFVILATQIRNASCQILLFSATYADDVREFAEKLVPNHNIITVKKEKLSLDGIKQFWLDCKSQENKYEVLSDIFGLLNVGKSVIFVQSRETAKKLTASMREKGHSCGILHGADMAKEVRDKVLDEFRLGTTKVLITTNVLARGIDVLGVSLVVNFDIPVTRENRPDPETYLHRIGRTGRFGRKGAAINFVYDNKSKRDLAEIEAYYEKEIIEAPADDLEALEKLLSWT